MKSHVLSTDCEGTYQLYAGIYRLVRMGPLNEAL